MLGPDTQGFHISDTNGKNGPLDKNFYGDTDVAEWLTDASVKFIQDYKDQPFFLYLSHWDVHTPIRARKEVTAKYDKKLKSGTWSREWNTTYAAMIEAVDTSLGRVVAALKESGKFENTLLSLALTTGVTQVQRQTDL